MAIEPALQSLIRRDRLVVAAGLAAIAGLGWLYLAQLAAGMQGIGMGAIAMPGPKPWAAADFVLMFVMWAVMMAAMMIPSAAPMILLYAAVARKTAQKTGASGMDVRPAAHSGAFAAGYLAVWTGFSVAATVLQWALAQAALLTPMMAGASPWLGGGLLIAAGLYQMTPLKRACLDHCRSPVQFVAAHWRPGAAGALRMGLEHGAFCLGCCWGLMALLFVGGVMNLLWIAALAAFVLAEKLLPRGAMAGRLAGALMIAAGLWMITPG